MFEVVLKPDSLLTPQLLSIINGAAPLLKKYFKVPQGGGG
jgi:hypothetical protein